MDSTENQASLQPSISIESTNSDESGDVEKMEKLHEQAKDISAQFENMLSMKCLKENSFPLEIKNCILDLQASFETMERSTKSLLTASQEVPSEMPEYRSNPGRRRPTADSALGSSHYASTVSSKWTRSSNLTGSRYALSGVLGIICEPPDEKTTRYVFETDFNRSVPNDFSARTAVENTESSESDNEKQPVYSSDESRLSSLPEKVEQSVQTDLSTSDKQISRSVQVTEIFYKLELSDDNDHMPETNQNQSASVTLQELSLAQSESDL
ncbi:hypothetical protein ACF0H5_024062 [Mactra antiquata]